jgi:hypothetical protein
MLVVLLHKNKKRQKLIEKERENDRAQNLFK